MKRTLIVSASMVLLALCVMLISFSMTEKKAAPAPEPVLLLVEDDTGAFFRQLRLGAQKAVGSAGGELVTETVRPADLDRMTAKWSVRSYGGAVVYIEDEALRQAILNMLDAAGIPAVLIGSRDETHAAVYWNEGELGRCAAALAAGASRVCLAGGSEEARQAAQAVLGDRLISWEEADRTCPDQAILALDAASTRNCCLAKADEGWSCALYGVDPGESRVSVLETGVVQALLFLNPYASGYQAASMTLTDFRPQHQAVAWEAVWPQEMYDAQHVKLVFPLLN